MTYSKSNHFTSYHFTDGCTGCGACLLTCPQHAIRPGAGAEPPVPLLVLPDRCDGCGECLEICPADAIYELAGSPAGVTP